MSSSRKSRTLGKQVIFQTEAACFIQSQFAAEALGFRARPGLVDEPGQDLIAAGKRFELDVWNQLLDHVL